MRVASYLNTSQQVAQVFQSSNIHFWFFRPSHKSAHCWDDSFSRLTYSFHVGGQTFCQPTGLYRKYCSSPNYPLQLPEAKSPLINTTSTAEYAAQAAKISDRLAVVNTASDPAKIIVNSAIKPNVSDGRDADIV